MATTVATQRIILHEPSQDHAKDVCSLPWSQIFDEHYPAIYRYAFYRLRSQEDAEDLAAQVFVEAIASLDRFIDTGKPMIAWLFGIARNLVANRVRRQARAENADRRNMQSGTEIDFSEGALERVDLQHALNRLPGEQREVLVLRFVSGLTTLQIAEIMGKKPVAVYSLQARGIATLKRLLAVS